VEDSDLLREIITIAVEEFYGSPGRRQAFYRRLLVLFEARGCVVGESCRGLDRAFDQVRCRRADDGLGSTPPA
jgi:hypothetical protein